MCLVRQWMMTRQCEVTDRYVDHMRISRFDAQVSSPVRKMHDLESLTRCVDEILFFDCLLYSFSFICISFGIFSRGLWFSCHSHFAWFLGDQLGCIAFRPALSSHESASQCPFKTALKPRHSKLFVKFALARGYHWCLLSPWATLNDLVS